MARTNNCKCGSVELSQREAKALLDTTPYIVNGKYVYHLRWSHGLQGVYSYRVYDHPTMLTKYGEYRALTAREVNQLIGYKLFYEL